VTLFGAGAALVGPFMFWNWFHFPLDFTLAEVADLVIGWTLAGLVLAWVLKPQALSADEGAKPVIDVRQGQGPHVARPAAW
jgi:hypothetical protein